MRPRFPLGSFAWVSSLLLLALAIPNSGLSQPLAPGSPELAPEVRERLSAAAEDTLLPPWQREFMVRLARGGGTSALDSATTGVPAALPERAPAGTDGSWAELVVGARHSHSAIYDPVRDRMVVFGGQDASGPRNDLWALSLAGTPAWTVLTPTGTPPSARAGHSAIYDPVRDRVVVFGGADASHARLNDIWALSLAGTPTWTQLMPTGTLPTARSDHSAVYDPVRDRMVVFGGFYYDSVGGFLSDVWALPLAGTPAWTALTPTGTPPSARAAHSAIYDPARDRMVVFGGLDGSSYFNDVWALSLAGTPVWAARAPSGAPPSARAWHRAIYDPVRDRMVVFGGEDGSSYRNDVWALLLAGTSTWVELTPTSTPPSARYGHSAIYDPVRDRMVVFGGGDDFGHRLNDIWALSLAGPPAWTALTPTGTPPSARYGHSAIYDPVRDCMVVFGGLDASYTLRNDIWALSLAGSPAWTALTPSGTPPIARTWQSAMYDPVRDRMVVFGGADDFGYRNDVWALSLAGTPAWTALTPSGTPPSARQSQSVIFDPVRDRMVVFGGSYWDGQSTVYLNDVRALSLAGTPAWTALTPTGTPPSARAFHTAIYDPVRDRMVVFGGNDCTRCNDVRALSLAGTPAWTALAPTGAPPSARSFHGAIYDPVRDRMVVFGGQGGSGLNDVWALGWGTPVDVPDRATHALISYLRSPAPNPSNGMTRVSYSISKVGRVALRIYDVRGRLVRMLVDGERRAGAETVVWDGTSDSGTRVGAGVYFVRLVGPGIQATRQAVLLK